MAASSLSQIHALSGKPLSQIMTALRQSDTTLEQAASGIDGATALIDLSKSFEHPAETLAVAHIL